MNNILFILCGHKDIFVSLPYDLFLLNPVYLDIDLINVDGTLLPCKGESNKK